MAAHNSIDLAGKRFGRLTVISVKGRDRNRQAIWTCNCDCGSTVDVLGGNLRRGLQVSCGCQRSETITAASITHGLSKSVEYQCLKAAIARCTNRQNKAFHRYGGRGVTVCDRWIHGESGMSGVECLIADIGLRPSGRHSLERRDNDGPYAPENVYWGTAKDQAINRRSTRFLILDGQKISISEWCKRTGISRNAVNAHVGPAEDLLAKRKCRACGREKPKGVRIDSHFCSDECRAKGA